MSVTPIRTALINLGLDEGLRYVGFSYQVNFADQLMHKIQLPEYRAKFAAMVLVWAATVNPSAVESPTEYQWQVLDDARPTPCGPQELWSN